MSREEIYLSTVQKKALGFLMLFIAYMALTILWSPSTKDAQYKILYLVSSSLVTMLGGLYIASHHDRRIRFFISLTIFAGIVAGGVQYIVETNELIRSFVDSGLPLDILGPGKGSYQRLSYIMAFGSISAVGLFIFQPLTIPVRILLVGVAGFCLYILGLSGGRGGAVVFLFVFAVYLILAPVLGKKGRAPNFTTRVLPIIVLASAAALFMVVRVAQGDDSVLIARLMHGLSGSSSLIDVNERRNLWRAAISYWYQFPILGTGLGGFSIMFGAGDISLYPHNFLIEVLTEGGIIGFALFMAFLVLAGVGAYRRIRFGNARDSKAMVIGLCLGGGMLAMFSGDVATHREMWMPIGFLMMPSAANKSKSHR